ncbi:hypothetical protein BOX15_Mlig006893g1 [Macrostomum lignano]|uniref:R3H-associated N-terminal domain-containing protein n=1 Tax=Macrostomum lignano TaxID=282301 RepID=A0A267F6U8_9PLAT|nr:hypothetical protein BOX15_Mlig006893g1 [Macrostomum lignano]
MDIASSSGVSMSSASLASSITDADDRMSVSSNSTLDPPRPLGLAAMRRLRPRRPLPRQQQQHQQHQGGGGGGSVYGRPGKRWKRRQVNEAYLHSLAAVAEVTDEDVSGCPWPESPLSSLFLDPAQMLAWRQFNELTDEQQADFLAKAGGDKDEEEEQLAEDAELKAVLVQPAGGVATAGQAWSRLSATCRDFALHRATPGSRFHAELGRLETELRDLFQDGCAPWADWVSGPLAPCDRLVVHSAAGYLGLQSASEDAENGSTSGGGTARCVCVRRWPNRPYRPPAGSLTAHLAVLRARRERAVLMMSSLESFNSAR